MFNDYLHTKEGMLSQHFSRTANQFMFIYEGELKTKKSTRPEDARKFRRALKNKLRSNNRRRFRSKILLEIIFRVPEDSQLSVQNLVKNYLDLMHKSMPEVDQEEGILFIDDDQIEILHSSCFYGSNKPELIVRAYRFSSFLLDVQLAEKISLDMEDRLNNLFDEDSRRDPFLDLEELEKLKETYTTDIEKDLYKLKHHNIIIDIQEFLLERSHISLNTIFLIYRAYKKKDYLYNWDIYDSLEKLTENILLFTFNHVEIGGGPIEPGTKIEFRNRIIEKIQFLKKKYKILFPLYVPISMTVVYTPAKYNSLDTDNLAKHVIPRIIEEFNPPDSNISGFSEIKNLKKLELKEMNLKKTRIRLSSYQIIKIPRNENTPDEGKIDLILCDGITGKFNNVWRKVESIINDWKD